MAFDSFAAVDADTRALRAAMTVPPPPGRLWQIDQTIRQLKSHGIWQKLDVLWVMASHDAQAARLNWKAPASFALTEVNSPTFTADRGYAGNGSTSYLNTGWNPATNGVNYTLNSASLGAYINGGTDAANSGTAAMGALVSGQGAFFMPRGNTGGQPNGNIRGRLNQSVSTNEFATDISTNRGLTAIDRSGSTNTNAYKNGGSVGSSASASSSVSSGALFIGGLNSSGAYSNGSDFRIAEAFAGASLSAAQHAALFRISQDFFRAFGANA